MVLKGMLGAPQLPRFYKDLCDPRFASALAIVHSRFSTNTFPSWALAHPFRFVAHNGEINTLRGNVNWMRAREHALGEFAEVRPVIPRGASDSAQLRRRARAARARGPAARARGDDDGARGVGGPRRPRPRTLRGFYAYHEKLMEPWDGPASITFSDGRDPGREARPQRAAARALGADRRRLGRAGVRDGRDAGRARAGGQARAAEAGRAVDRRPRARRRCSPTARWSARSRRGGRTGSGRRGDDPARGRRARRRAARARGAARARCGRRSATRARTSTS